MLSPSTEALSKSIRFAKGVGDKLAQVLAKKKIMSIEDALYFFPRSYEDRSRILNVSELPAFGTVNVVGRILRAHPVSYTRSRSRFFDVFIEDLEKPANLLQLRWFRRPYVFEKLKAGTIVMARGELQNYRGQRQLSHPEIEVMGQELKSEVEGPGLIPVYSQTEGLYQKTFRKIEKNILSSYGNEIEEILPKEIIKEKSFVSRAQAFRDIHFPPKEVPFEDLVRSRSAAHQRLIYEEFFLFQLALLKSSGVKTGEKGISFQKPEESWEKLRESLGFRFTNAQRRVLKEILEDMSSPRRMHRLVQGDVGSGKTAVAAAASLIALESGYQVALMAPTEVLAQQHFLKFQKWFEKMDFEVVLFTGSMKVPERREIFKKARDRKPRIFCGTHALFEDAVEFANLGFVIVDEQHRFGVRQRSRLSRKGKSTDVLVMTATPIPRSLALTLYGDLELSLIDELPPGRQTIETKIFKQNQREAYVPEVRQQLEQGRQAYMVYPLIEESEALSLQSIQQDMAQLKEDFEGFRVEALHGRMESTEKLAILEAFRKGEVHVLVSTTVIEVGVDVPNATLMIIQHAERFGLSQLHQLRGRVGRGAHQSYCFLVASHLGSAQIIKRLKTLEKTNNGFEIAEIDLEMRGHGELMGTRQSGLPEFRLGLLPRDIEILKEARRDARIYFEKDPHFASNPQLKAYFDSKIQNMEKS